MEGLKTIGPIAFNGRVERMCGAQGVHVRLANDHLLAAIPWDRSGFGAPLRLGEAVSVEMAPQDMKGWRLVRRP